MKLINILNIIILFLLVSLLNGCLENQDQPKKNAGKEKMAIDNSNEWNFSFWDNTKWNKLVLDLSGRWRFSLGDDMVWKEKSFNDNDWEKINVPSSWENQGFHGYNGYAWYRKSFKITSDLAAKDLYLVLGYVDDVDQTFINGNLIGISGGFPNNYRTAYNAFRKYYIPKEFLNKNDENIIAVRVFDDELEGGIMSGEIGLFTYEGGFEPEINLSGIWDFKIGDDSSFIKNDNIVSNSVKLMVPAHWEIQGYADYDGFAWYKKTFYLPKEFDGENMVLLLGRIDDIDQTFVNGAFVGSTGKWNFKVIPTEFNQNEEWLQRRVYSVPKKLLKFGQDNTITVRVYDGFRDGGIYDGPIGLIKQSNYKKYFNKSKS